MTRKLDKTVEIRQLDREKQKANLKLEETELSTFPWALLPTHHSCFVEGAHIEAGVRDIRWQ